jgi:hypothetical protein
MALDKAEQAVSKDGSLREPDSGRMVPLDRRPIRQVIEQRMHLEPPKKLLSLNEPHLTNDDHKSPIRP